jgi:hypothetical protein
LFKGKYKYIYEPIKSSGIFILVVIRNVSVPVNPQIFNFISRGTPSPENLSVNRKYTVGNLITNS